MNKLHPAWLVVAAIAISAFFINPESLWIDEGNTVARAMKVSVQEWYRYLLSAGGSDAQMPGYMAFIWCWWKVTGLNEFALRASNVIWLLIALLALKRIPFYWLALLVSPFVLYYLSELRPYLMQVAGAAVVVAGFLELPAREKIGWRKILIGSAILCASSLTGVIWAAGCLAGALVLRPSLFKGRFFWREGLAFSPLFLLLAWHYLLTILSGAAPAAMGGSVVLSLGAAGYELAGLMGLGPGRNELRDDPASLVRFAMPLLIGSVFLFPTLLSGSFLFLKSMTKRQITALAVTVGLPLACFLLLVEAKDFRLLGRHLAPLSVLTSIALARCLRGSEGIPFGKLTKPMAILAVLACLASSVQLRIADRHRKDDYRAASTMAKEALGRGKNVIWAADSSTAHVYGVPSNLVSERLVMLPSDRHPYPNLDGGEIVFLSKPDINDARGELRRQLDAGGFRPIRRLQSFEIYESLGQQPQH